MDDSVYDSGKAALSVGQEYKSGAISRNEMNTKLLRIEEAIDIKSSGGVKIAADVNRMVDVTSNASTFNNAYDALKKDLGE